MAGFELAGGKISPDPEQSDHCRQAQARRGDGYGKTLGLLKRTDRLEFADQFVDKRVGIGHDNLTHFLSRRAGLLATSEYCSFIREGRLPIRAVSKRPRVPASCDVPVARHDLIMQEKTALAKTVTTPSLRRPGMTLSLRNGGVLRGGIISASTEATRGLLVPSG